MFQVTDTKNAPAAIGPYSQAMAWNNLIFTSGQVVGTTIAEQAEQVMKNLGAVLEANGASFENAIKTTCFLADMADFGAFNEVYAKYFTGKPSRSCVAVRELPKGVLCEVEVIAVK